MPEVGFQHKLGGIGSINPFIEEPPRPSAYPPAERAALQGKLDSQLGPEYISSRPGAGGMKVHYLAADKAINLANEVFGFDGWSSTIKEITVDFIDEYKDTGKYSLGVSVIMRVTLRDGTFHEDIGYGHIENCKGKAAAYEKAKKEGTTDAMKRALRNFGNVLGNCIYDKSYLKEVTKIRVPPTRFNPARLHRHPDVVPRPAIQPPQMHAAPQPSIGQSSMAPVKQEISKSEIDSNLASFDEYGGDEFDDEFGTFGEADASTIDGLMPDEVALELDELTPTNQQAHNMNTANQNQGFNRTSIGGQQMGAGQNGRGQPGAGMAYNPGDSPLINRRASPNQFQQPNPQTPTPKQSPHIQNPPAQHNQQQRPPPQQQHVTPQPRPPPPAMNQPPRQGALSPNNAIPTLMAPQLNQQAAVQQPASVGFFSARVAETVQKDGNVDDSAIFNPQHQTSIPRSLGIDTSKSSPIPRTFQGNKAAINTTVPNTIQKPDFGSAGGFSTGRQIGMPPPGAPQHNRTLYKPPSVIQGAGTKRPAENNSNGPAQPALGNASNAQLNQQGQGGPPQGHDQFGGNDPKRMRN
ncbi:RAD52 DNA repair protein [Peziza echinospora]|nr:RAD52 DNA repair protein [Peziza echinospora]